MGNNARVTVIHGRIGQKIEVERIIAVLEKRPLTPVPPLRHMVRMAGKHKSWKSRHANTQN